MFTIKRLYPDSKVPVRASETSIGYDVFAYLPTREHGLWISASGRALVPLGFAATVPEGCYGRIAPRSGLASKNGIHVMAGVVDRDYTGEWHVLLHNCDIFNAFTVRHGDKIAQVILERAMISEMHILPDGVSLPETGRGAGGFGSTGS